MGIQGLLPLLKSIQLPVSMAELSGSTVGVDVYCWLHKGAYGCALQLAEGADSDIYIKYVMRRVNMMLHYKVKPILVFDGGYLPSKSDKETERRNKRKENRAQGLTQLQNGNRTKALEFFQKSIDITPQMAYKVIKVCREKGVDCIVAPYEADAQLAYLTKSGITQFTISEDSDLLVYGCEKVIFKMDANGSGLMINLKNLPKLTALRMDGFSEKKFREMCILSGCDYLQSVKGMGLITAHKFLRKHSTVNKLIGTLRLNNKMRVPKDYETRFAQAEQTFLYQIVFDPKTNRLVPLNPVPEEIDSSDLHFAGHNGKWKQEHALQLALGNLNPITGARMGDIEVDKVVSFDKQQEESGHEKRANAHPSTTSSTTPSTTTTATTPSIQSKGPHSVLSSNRKYEAEKNLNGSFRDTKSSEKTNTPFITPMRTKRMRSEAEENHSETSKLAKLYSTADDELSVRRCLSEADDPDDDDSPCENEAPLIQPRKRPKNPFRSPVLIKRRQNSEHVVSRYFFGLAGMENIKEEPCSKTLDENATKTDDEEDSTAETPLTKCPGVSQLSSSPAEDSSVTLSAQTGMESGYSGLSPTESSKTDQLAQNNTTPLSTKTQRFSSTGIDSQDRHRSRNCENGKPRHKIKKIKSSQTSLDKFAYVKNRTTDKETKPISSPKRTVLGDKFFENCNHDELGEKEEKIKDEDDFTKILKNEEEARNGLCETQITHFETGDNIDYKTQIRPIALRSKPTTGLSRCRSVGVSRHKHGHKTKSSEKKSVEVPLLTAYFAYRGRPQGIFS